MTTPSPFTPPRPCFLRFFFLAALLRAEAFRFFWRRCLRARDSSAEEEESEDVEENESDSSSEEEERLSSSSEEGGRFRKGSGNIAAAGCGPTAWHKQRSTNRAYQSED